MRNPRKHTGKKAGDLNKTTLKLVHAHVAELAILLKTATCAKTRLHV